MRRQNTLRTLAGAILPLTLLLSSCASGQPSGGSSASANAEKAYSASTNPDNQAIEKVENLASLSDNVARAYQRSLSQCMTERGFPNYKVPAGETEPPLLQTTGFEPLTVADARTRGYKERWSLVTAELEEQSRTMSDAEMQALNGTEGKGGCQQEATRAVFGSEESRATIRKVYITAVHYLNNDAITKDLGPATEKWAQCMKERFGGDYTSPDMARLQYRQNNQDTHELAINDATCREATGLDTEQRKMAIAYLSSFLEKEQGLIEQVTTAKKTAEENARKILS